MVSNKNIIKYIKNILDVNQILYYYYIIYKKIYIYTYTTIQKFRDAENSALIAWINNILKQIEKSYFTITVFILFLIK